jgi:hypothetical protein
MRFMLQKLDSEAWFFMHCKVFFSPQSATKVQDIFWCFNRIAQPVKNLVQDQRLGFYSP